MERFLTNVKKEDSNNNYMKKLNSLAVFLLLALAACSIDDNPVVIPYKEEVPFVNGTTLVFVTQDAGRKLMGTSDEYSQALTKFDIASRTRNPANDQEEQYLAYAAEQAQEWDDNEVDVLRVLINNV